MKTRKFRKESLLLLVVALIAISFGYLFYRERISADTNSKPIIISTGWGFIDGENLHSITLAKVLSSGVLVYSFNDQNTDHTGWTYLSDDCQKYKSVKGLSCLTDIPLNPDLTYITYNKNKALKLDRTNFEKLDSYTDGYRSGWHFFTWKENGTSRSDFVKKLNLRSQTDIKSLDYFVDQKAASSVVYQEEIVSPKKLALKTLGNRNSNSSVTKLNQKNAWVYFFDSNFKQVTAKNPEKGAYMFGINAQPILVEAAQNNNGNLYEDLNTLGLTTIRYITYDTNIGDRAFHVQRAREYVQAGQKLMGTFVPNGSIPEDRRGTVLDRNGKPYESYFDVIQDIGYYYEQMTKGSVSQAVVTQNRQKLIALVRELYFKNLVIPRLNLYKDIIKDWQQWNEPDGNLGTSKWGIPAEVLVLITKGSVDVKAPITGDAGHIEHLSLGSNINTGNKNYDLSQGVSKLLKDTCSDCRLISAGFFLYRPAYFKTLKDNNYNQFVGAHEVHLNLAPKIFMGYTQYHTIAVKTLRIYDALCDKDGKQDTYDCNKPLYATENGSPSDVIFSNKTSTASGTYSMAYSEEFQADDLIKRLLVISNLGIKNFNWNGYINNPGGGDNCPKNLNNNNFYEFSLEDSRCAHQFKGLYYKFPTGSGKKPSYESYQIGSAMLRYAKSIVNLKRGDDNHSDKNPSFLYKITDTDGKTKYAAWCEPYWDVKDPEQDSPNPAIYKTWDYEDRNCSKKINLSQYGLSGKVIITTRDGSTKEANSNEITLTKSPIFIESK